MAPVRNIRGIGRRKPIPVYVFIPPIYGAKHKITVTRSDGTIDDITNIIYKGEVEDGVTNTIGRFSFEVDNSLAFYNGLWKGNEIVKLYVDYDTSATTLRFRGRIENVSFRNNKIKIVGRSETLKIMEINVNYSITAETSVVLKTLFDTYAPDFTYTNVATSTTMATVNWYQKPMNECIQELCRLAGFDFYVDSVLDAHYFESGSRQNTTEAVVHDMNLISIDDFGQDYSRIKNKVIVEGRDIEGLPLISSSTSTDENYGVSSDLGKRESIIKDENVTNSTQAQERATSELSFSLNPNTIGEAVCMGLATIQPGEQIKISAPDSNLPPSNYIIVSYKHLFGEIMKTLLVINKEAIKLQRILKDRIAASKEVNIKNIYGMDYTWNFDFESDSGTHSNTQIISGVLKTDGSTSGTWESDLLEIESNVTGVELRINGTSLAGVTGFLSINGGVSYRQIYGTGTPGGIPPGKKLKLRIPLVSADTQISGLVLLYK